MFKQDCDWSRAIVLICDIAKGNATIAVRSYSNHFDGEKFRPEISGWDHQQIQAHAQDHGYLPRLFSLAHLADILRKVSGIKKTFYAYEVDGASSYDEDAKALLRELSDIVVTTVKLTVGDVVVAWFLVSLNDDRDTVYWNMKYEGRDRRPGYDLPPH